MTCGRKISEGQDPGQQFRTRKTGKLISGKQRQGKRLQEGKTLEPEFKRAMHRKTASARHGTLISQKAKPRKQMSEGQDLEESFWMARPAKIIRRVRHGKTMPEGQGAGQHSKQARLGKMS